MSETDNPFHLTPRKPLNIIKRPWALAEFWTRYFPMDEKGDVTFTPPWPFPRYQVNDGETGRALIRSIHKGKSRLLLLLAGILFLCWFFFWNTPVFLLLFFLGLCLLRHYAKTRLFPGLCLPLLKDHPLLSAEPETCSLTGVPETPKANGRFLWSGLVLTLTIPTLAYWWEAQDTLALLYGIPALFSLILCLYSFWPLLGDRELPMKILQELGIFSVAAGWGILFWFYYQPSEPKPMGQWGYANQSPSSSLLGYYQDYMSPVSLDRRLQAIDFRPSGLPMEWTAYYLSPEEYTHILAALKKTGDFDMTDKTGIYSKKIQQNHMKQRFPEWWKPSPGAQTTSFAYSDIPHKAQLNERKKQVYKQGRELVLTALSPAKDRTQTLIYDPQTSLLYMFSRQKHLSPFESLLLYLN